MVWAYDTALPMKQNPIDPGVECMKIQMLLFAQLAERIGEREITLEVEDGLTVGDALQLLHQSHPAMSDLHGSYATAVNEAFARVDRVLIDGDCVALLPPVSGG